MKLRSGGCCSSKKLAIRLAAGTWCLACFVIVTAYSSVLISFIISPNLKPIIESIRDIPNVPGLRVVAIKGASVERVLSVIVIMLICYSSFASFFFSKIKNFKTDRPERKFISNCS